MSNEDGKVPSCSMACLENEVSCPVSECNYWIPYEKENNCSLISIYKNGAMTLQQVGDRLGISLVRVCQIEKQIKKKLKTNGELTKLFLKK